MHDPTFKTWRSSYVQTIVFHFLVRTAWNLHAVQVLCREGLAVQAQPTLRAIIESAIDLRYISTNPQVLVTKWCLFEEIERYKFWRGRPEDERPIDHGFSEKTVSNRLRLLELHQQKSNHKPWTLRDLSRDWDLSDLRSRDMAACKALGEPEQRLHDIYKLLCSPLHGGTQAANDFVVMLGDGKFEMVRGLPERKSVFVPFFSLYALDVVIRASERCGAKDLGMLSPGWDDLGVTVEELGAAASADFRYVPAE